MLNRSLLFLFPLRCQQRDQCLFAFWGWINDTNVSAHVSVRACDCASARQSVRAETLGSEWVNKYEWWLSLLWKVTYCLWTTSRAPAHYTHTRTHVHTCSHTYKGKRALPLLHRLAEILHFPHDKGGKQCYLQRSRRQSNHNVHWLPVFLRYKYFSYPRKKMSGKSWVSQSCKI